jgi:hypothetical protein
LRLIRTQNPSRQRQLQFDDALPSRHLPRRPHWQLQHLAQGVQVGIPWSAVIRLPEVNAGLADTDLISDFRNRQTTLDASVAEMTAQTWFTRQCTDPCHILKTPNYWQRCGVSKSTDFTNHRDKSLKEDTDNALL